MAGIGEALEPLKTAVTNLFAGILEKVSEFFNYLMENKEVVIPIIIGIGAAFLTWAIVTTIQNLVSVLGTLKTAIFGVNAAMNANPIVLIVSLIAGLVAALVTLWNISEGFREAVTNVWETIKNVVGTVVNCHKKLFCRIMGIKQGVMGQFCKYNQNRYRYRNRIFHRSLGRTQGNLE